jgi:ribosomal protein L17
MEDHDNTAILISILKSLMNVNAIVTTWPKLREVIACMDG